MHNTRRGKQNNAHETANKQKPCRIPIYLQSFQHRHIKPLHSCTPHPLRHHICHKAEPGAGNRFFFEYIPQLASLSITGILTFRFRSVILSCFAVFLKKTRAAAVQIAQRLQMPTGFFYQAFSRVKRIRPPARRMRRKRSDASRCVEMVRPLVRFVTTIAPPAEICAGASLMTSSSSCAIAS